MLSCSGQKPKSSSIPFYFPLSRQQVQWALPLTYTPCPSTSHHLPALSIVAVIFQLKRHRSLPTALIPVFFPMVLPQLLSASSQSDLSENINRITSLICLKPPVASTEVRIKSKLCAVANEGPSELVPLPAPRPPSYGHSGF